MSQMDMIVEDSLQMEVSPVANLPLSPSKEIFAFISSILFVSKFWVQILLVNFNFRLF